MKSSQCKNVFYGCATICDKSCTVFVILLSKERESHYLTISISHAFLYRNHMIFALYWDKGYPFHHVVNAETLFAQKFCFGQCPNYLFLSCTNDTCHVTPQMGVFSNVSIVLNTHGWLEHRFWPGLFLLIGTFAEYMYLGRTLCHFAHFKYTIDTYINYYY